MIVDINQLVFTPAATLKTMFEVQAQFYQTMFKNELRLCRSYARLKRIGSCEQDKDDALLVMINPGSCRAMNSEAAVVQTSNRQQFQSNLKSLELADSYPDPAQYQLMRLMEIRNWKSIGIINLFDLVDANSKDFFNQIQDSEPSIISLTHPWRSDELNFRISKSNLVILGWGLNSVIAREAKLILNLLPNYYGVQIGENGFRYPSPYLKSKKLEWIFEICKNLETSARL